MDFLTATLPVIAAVKAEPQTILLTVFIPKKVQSKRRGVFQELESIPFSDP
jgi:hypothetical protein